MPRYATANMHWKAYMPVQRRIYFGRRSYHYYRDCTYYELEPTPYAIKHFGKLIKFILESVTKSDAKIECFKQN